MGDDILEHLCQHKVIDALDAEFALLMAELEGTSSYELLLGSALASWAVSNGDVCLDLARYARQPLLWLDGNAPLFAPELQRWRQVLQNSRVVGEPGAWTPLVLDERDRLYLYRYWDYEQRLAGTLKYRARQRHDVDTALLSAGLERLFPTSLQTPVNWQKAAAALAVLRGFSVISGGAGTGKTTTLAVILALLIEQAQANHHSLRIGLTAPTGKAAARVQEALRSSKERLAPLLAPRVLAAIPEQAQTLHRLLGVGADGVYCRYDDTNPLNLDVLVIDEASMVDLALMTKAVHALGPDTRLILLGDKDQLASVEAGTVLGELCSQFQGYSPTFAQQLAAVTQQSIEAIVPVGQTNIQPLQDSVILLRHSYRFSSDSGIGRLALSVNRGDGAGISALQAQEDVRWCCPPAENAEHALLDAVLQGYKPYLQQVRQQAPVETLFAAFQDYQVLCPQRAGRVGIETLNDRFEAMARAYLGHPQSVWYPGRPVMITRNDYQLRLFNGDIGITLPDPEQGERLRVYFQQPDGTLHSYPIPRLPVCEPVFAMTIHKSQGSEFNQVLLVLPEEDSRVLSRELIYTAVTRARTRLFIWGKVEVLVQAVGKSVKRASGLGEKLQNSG